MAANCATARVSWQEKLNEHCRQSKLQAPVFNLVSDRRGGRTAWSSSVSIQGSSFSARYFYAGEYINNAKEDAAEVAFTQLNSQPRLATALPGQLYAQPK
ncbi:conserved hypothetical protein [Microsporum canis CBS 113480]|uniref:DRBM domain-containing protein n=1 Tax=Arthroderma otae (strain ATCC MYA-4605 / CBS 113480) TaxID=554155 RepID=C5FFM9_ARTOC|nr:conserved hypothetical protein [Microsporum canis CBS 113480]EEQ29476.1 conserved hypothetical protein [Microsporum canis CBS 113480]